MRGRLLALVSVLVLVAWACGGGDGEAADSAGSDTSAAADSGSEDTVAAADDTGGSDAGGSDTGGSDSDDGGGAAPPSGSGSFTVNGESVSVSGVFRCEPFSASGDPDPRDLSIVIFGETGGANVDVIYHQGIGPEGESFEQIQLDVLLSLGGTSEQYDGLAANNIDGNWFSGGQPIMADQEPGTPLDGPPFTISGNNISGSLSDMAQSWPQDANGTASMSFDVDFPDEEMDC